MGQARAFRGKNTQAMEPVRDISYSEYTTKPACDTPGIGAHVDTLNAA